MEDSFTVDLDTEAIVYKGQTVFTFRIWNDIVARAVWKFDKSTGTLSLLVRAFQMGLLDASKHPIEVKYFQSAPFTEKDNRVNTWVPSQDLRFKLVCDYPKQLSEIPWDNFLFWQSQEDVCPEEMMDEFVQKAEDSKFLEILSEPTIRNRLSLLNVGSKYIVCATNYMRSYVPYSHGYGALEAGVWLHFLMEWVPSLLRPFLEHSDLNTFKIDYIYGQDMCQHNTPIYGSDDWWLPCVFRSSTYTCNGFCCCEDGFEANGDGDCISCEYSDNAFLNPPSSNPTLAPTNSPCDDHSPISGSEDWWFCSLHSSTYECNDGESCCCEDGFGPDDGGHCVACGSQLFQESTAKQVVKSTNRMLIMALAWIGFLSTLVYAYGSLTNVGKYNEIKSNTYEQEI